MLGSLQFSQACLRLYARPGLLAMSADINGDDFAPFHESPFLKEPGLGASVSWLQDGDTHWNSSQFDEDTCGFNFMALAYGGTAVNGVYPLHSDDDQVFEWNVARMVDSKDYNLRDFSI